MCWPCEPEKVPGSGVLAGEVPSQGWGSVNAVLPRKPLGAATIRRAVHRWRFTLGTVAFSLFLSAVGWRGEDYPAQELRIEIFRQGDWFWNPNWFGGHPTLGYSTLFPALGALVGATGLGVLATTAAVGVFEALVRHRASASYATAAFAFGMVSNLVVGRLQFTLGSAFALAAVAMLSRSRIVAAVLADSHVSDQPAGCVVPRDRLRGVGARAPPNTCTRCSSLPPCCRRSQRAACSALVATSHSHFDRSCGAWRSPRWRRSSRPNAWSASGAR